MGQKIGSGGLILPDERPEGMSALLQEMAEGQQARRALMERRWKEVQAITWRDVMSLREKAMYLLVLAVVCACVAMVVLLAAAVKNI